MILSWHMMMDFEPPPVGFILSDRNSSFGNLEATRECVMNVPTADLHSKVVRCGDTSGRRIDKFARIGFTPVPVAEVAPPPLAGCYASFEAQAG